MSISRTGDAAISNYVICTSVTRPSSTYAGLMIFETDTGLLLQRNTANTSWAQLTPEAALVATSETTTSTTYTNLTTAGPAVTVETGTKALVTIGAIENSSASVVLMSFSISGATTQGATDTRSLVNGVAGVNFAMSRTFNITGLTPGLNTFTTKYRVGGGTGTWGDREIIVVGIGE